MDWTLILDAVARLCENNAQYRELLDDVGVLRVIESPERAGELTLEQVEQLADHVGHDVWELIRWATINIQARCL